VLVMRGEAGIGKSAQPAEDHSGADRLPPLMAIAMMLTYESPSTAKSQTRSCRSVGGRAVSP
jgi:hypothetical protein